MDDIFLKLYVLKLTTILQRCGILDDKVTTIKFYK